MADPYAWYIFNAIFYFSYYKAQIVQYQYKYIATIWVVEITKI